MSKDGAGGGHTDMSPRVRSCACKNAATPTVREADPLSLALAVLDKELIRLHKDLEEGNGDEDETQHQLGILHQHMIDLSNRLVKE